MQLQTGQISISDVTGVAGVRQGTSVNPSMSTQIGRVRVDLVALVALKESLP